MRVDIGRDEAIMVSWKTPGSPRRITVPMTGKDLREGINRLSELRRTIGGKAPRTVRVERLEGGKEVLEVVIP